jgi:hypothetical protein
VWAGLFSIVSNVAGAWLTCCAVLLLVVRAPPCLCRRQAGFSSTAAPAPGETVAVGGGHPITVPHELPGQDPEGGSEVNFGDGESSEATATPRADSEHGRRTSDASFTFQDSRPSTDGRTGAASLAASAAAGAAAAAAGAPAAPRTPEADPVPMLVPPSRPAAAAAAAAAAAPEADGLGGSWQDLQVLRAQSMAQRSNSLHATHVSGAAWLSGPCGAQPSPGCIADGGCC